MQLLQIDLSERLAEINRIGNDLAETTDSPASKGRIRQLDKSYSEYIDFEIKALGKVKDTMQRMQDDLIRIQSREGELTSYYIHQIRNTFSDTVVDMKNHLNQLEERGRRLTVDNI